MKQLKKVIFCFGSALLITYNATAGDQQISNLVNATLDTLPQGTETNQQTPPQTSLRLSEVEDTVIENRLVELALAQPNYEQTLYQQKIFEYQLKKQRTAWLNLLTLSTTYNDQTFAKSNTVNPTYVYPKFYIGVTIPLGLIASAGTDLKMTKQSQLIEKAQQAELAKSIKASVLSNYKQYKANEKLLLMQNQAVDDEQAAFLSTEQKFRNGTVTVEAYNEASKKYNDEVVKAINLQLQQDLIKVELERLIGRRLEDVLK